MCRYRSSVKSHQRYPQWRGGAQICLTTAIVVIAAMTSSARAGITRYENTDRDAWFDDVGGASAVITIGFSDFADNTFITDQYQHLGVTFTDGNDITAGFAPSSWPQDGWGLDGNGDIDLMFDAPRTFIAVDFPGFIRFELFLEGELVGDALFGESGRHDNFAGVTSTIAFDSAVLSNFAGPQANIDDLHFTRIPGPSGLIVLSGVLFARSRVRRRDAHVSGYGREL